MKNEMIAEPVKVSEKYKQTEVGSIPVDWDVFFLSDLLIKIADVDHYMPKTEQYGIPYVMTGDLKNFVSEIDFESCKKISPIDFEKLSKKVKNLKGDIILARYATVGTVSFVNVNIDFVVSYSCVTIKPNTAKLYDLYLYYYFKSSIFKFEVKNKVNANIQDNVGIGDLNKMKIPLPANRDEQIIIANALSDADAMIASLEKLIEKKKKIKQGAMQELLSSTGSDGKLKEGWVKKKLGDVCEIRKGQLITDSTRVDGDVPVIAGGKTPAYFHNKSNRKKNTITISGSGASAGYVSFHSYPIFASDCSTIESSEKYSVEYIYYFLQLNQERIYRMQTGGAQPHIHPSDLFPLTISMPSLELQNYISNSILDMDREITMLVEKLNKAIQIKQGMMQNLLTGKIRLV